MHIFKPVIQSVVDFYRPSVIVLQVRDLRSQQMTTQ